MATYRIICSGFGGQGVLTAGMMLINAGFELGKNVTWSPSYGSEMRGGTANCNVVISDDEIGTPVLDECDILIAMNGPSIDKFKDSVVDGGYIFVNTSIYKGEVKPAGKDITIVPLPCTEIAAKQDNMRGANIAMLGAVAKKTGLFDIDEFEQEINKYFEKKGKHNPKNAACLRAGYDAV